MKIVNLIHVEHNRKIGDVCEYIEPNIKEDSLFVIENEVIGFYIRDISKHSQKLSQLISIANNELLSKNVPKSTMKRSSGMIDTSKEVLQFSTILGAIAPKPHMRRPYPSISSVHYHKTAKTFVKAMLLASEESSELIKQLAPNIYDKQLERMSHVDEQWKFGKLFTSSISNYNISANFHIDNANIKDCVNVIICKRKNSKGGCTTVPDYGITVDSCDNSMLVYPAWRNVHAVTPIIPVADNGYRNTLVFYPLKAFLNNDNDK
jgi:hypothetical protein